MLAVVDILNKQYKVKQGDRFLVNRLSEYKEGDTIDFDKVLMLIDGATD